MNRYLLIRRLRAPAFLFLVGVIALLAQAHVLSWGESWPLFLIVAGVLLLAERAALNMEGYPPYPGNPCQGTSQRGAWQETSQGVSQSGEQSTSTSNAPSEPHDFGDHRSGVQS